MMISGPGGVTLAACCTGLRVSRICIRISDPGKVPTMAAGPVSTMALVIATS